MKKIIATLCMITPLASFAALPIDFFESPEHLAIGDNVKLFFSADDQGQSGIQLHMPNGLALTYGDILTFGDYYEVPLHPISQGLTLEEQTSRFLTGFNSFAKDPAAVTEAPQIVALIQDEEKKVQDAMTKGETAEQAYADISWDFNRQANCITGGGCSSTWWTKEGRFLTLAKTDFDHFGEHAWLSYQVGHDAAIAEAIKAGKDQSRSELEVAYAMNAFACHFLSDRFAAGHIRTPRVELATMVTPQVAGSLLASFMHNEENSNGLHVHNGNNDYWVVYGDRSYLNAESVDNRRILNEALQLSAKQIFAAYQSGQMTDDNAVFAFVPMPNETGDTANVDISPLFYWDQTQQLIFRRADMTNVYDKHWTSNWWGWSTLTELSRERGLPPVYKNLLTEQH